MWKVLKRAHRDFSSKNRRGESINDGLLKFLFVTLVLRIEDVYQMEEVFRYEISRISCYDVSTCTFLLRRLISERTGWPRGVTLISRREIRSILTQSWRPGHLSRYKTRRPSRAKKIDRVFWLYRTRRKFIIMPPCATYPTPVFNHCEMWKDFDPQLYTLFSLLLSLTRLASIVKYDQRRLNNVTSHIANGISHPDHLSSSMFRTDAEKSLEDQILEVLSTSGDKISFMIEFHLR